MSAITVQGLIDILSGYDRGLPVAAIGIDSGGYDAIIGIDVCVIPYRGTLYLWGRESTNHEEDISNWLEGEV